jgi:Leucine-rich repeat (LRR) protein
MKNTIKTLLAILALVLCSSSYAQIINIPDPIFKAKLLQSSTTNDIALDSFSNPIKIDKNNDGQIQQSEALRVFELNVASYFYDFYDFFKIIDLTGIRYFRNLKTLYCYGNQLSSLDVSGLSSLEDLNCEDNQLSSLDASGLSNLKYLDCNYNQLTSLNVSGLSNLTHLNCSINQLSSLNVSGLNSLTNLDCNYNQLSSLDVSGLNSLTYLDCADNQIKSLDVSGFSKLIELECSNNQLSSLEVIGLSNLTRLGCINNQLSSLDVSGLSKLRYLECGNNQLQTLYLKNTDIHTILSFYSNPALKLICVDPEDYTMIKQKSDGYGYTNVIIGTFCDGTSGGFYYSLSGNVRYDAANNGCTAQDSIFPYLKMKIENSDASCYIISDASGVYSLSLPADTFTITLEFEHPYFTISPTSTTIIMPDTSFPNFCITPNGIHNDVTVTIIPTTPARPGLSDATYKIVYTNKGTTTQNGTITFQYDEALSDFVSSNPSPTNSSAGVLTFDYSNLNIFESREIIVTLRTNSPADAPPVNAGDELKFIATITGSGIDETIKDNSFNLTQTVVGSIDPNDKTCLQGNIVTPSIIGEYVDYLIRFENTGTAAAENVVITDYIDLSKFDISTLALTSTSHSCRTAISEGNKVQFIFDKIMLPFTEPEKHGYVAFKIKTLTSLAVGDTLSNKADIYFDYNLPVATNTAMSLILTPTPVKQNNYNIRLQLMPNPSDGYFVLRLEGKGSLAGQVKIYDLTGAEVYNQAIVHNDISSHKIHADLPAGMYYLQLQSDGNSWTEKLVIGQ